MFASYVDKARSIFVARLPWITSPEILRQYFGKYGTISRTSIVYDKETGRSRRYGFVEFSSKSTLQQVIDQKPHVIDGVEVIVKEVSEKPGTDKQTPTPIREESET